MPSYGMSSHWWETLLAWRVKYMQNINIGKSGIQGANF